MFNLDFAQMSAVILFSKLFTVTILNLENYCNVIEQVNFKSISACSYDANNCRLGTVCS